MKPIKVLFFIAVSFIITITLLFFENNIPSIGYDEQEASMTYEEFREIFGNDVFGYQLGFINPLYGPMGEKLIFESIEDELVLNFSNFSGNNSEFLLKIFWNYQEVYFQVDNGEFNNQYIFQSDNGESIEWSIKLSDTTPFDGKNDTAYLTALIIQEPKLYRKDLKFLDHNNYGIASAHYVFIDKDIHSWVPAFDSSIFATFNDYLEEDYYDFNITTLEDEEVYHIPRTYLKVSGGEEVEFDFLLGDITGEGNQKFLVLALLDGNQIEINGDLLLPIKLPLNLKTNKPIPQQGRFSIVAPDEPGRYEFIAYAVGILSRRLVIK